MRKDILMKWIIMHLESYCLNLRQGSHSLEIEKNNFSDREPPFGYENGENIGEIKRAILKGITEEHLKKILNKDLRSLVERLLQVNRKKFDI